MILYSIVFLWLYMQSSSLQGAHCCFFLSWALRLFMLQTEPIVHTVVVQWTDRIEPNWYLRVWPCHAGEIKLIWTSSFFFNVGYFGEQLCHTMRYKLASGNEWQSETVFLISLEIYIYFFLKCQQLSLDNIKMGV